MSLKCWKSRARIVRASQRTSYLSPPTSYLPSVTSKIYTRTGDTGDTALFGGGRVTKNHQRVAAYGDIDELNSVLGLARAVAPQDFFDALFENVQRDLFSIGGHLATPDPDKVRKALEKAALSSARVTEFEAIIDAADQELAPLKAFVLPGGTVKAAHLHVTRAVCRRAERSVVALAREEDVPPLFLVYLNRLSDVLFTLARLANHRAGIGDVTW
jgi:cob(I)alamin adenosyltransferase